MLAKNELDLRSRYQEEKANRVYLFNIVTKNKR